MGLEDTQERSIGHDRLLAYCIEELTDAELVELVQDVYGKFEELHDILAIAKAETRRRVEGVRPQYGT